MQKSMLKPPITRLGGKSKSCLLYTSEGACAVYKDSNGRYYTVIGFDY